MHITLKRLVKTLIGLRVRADWSEPLLVAHTTALEISRRGSYLNIMCSLRFSHFLFITLCIDCIIYRILGGVFCKADTALAGDGVVIFVAISMTQCCFHLHFRMTRLLDYLDAKTAILKPRWDGITSLSKLKVSMFFIFKPFRGIVFLFFCKSEYS